jgi:hypothetical protein
MTNCKGFGRRGYDIIEMLSWHLIGGTEENHERLRLTETSLEIGTALPVYVKI